MFSRGPRNGCLRARAIWRSTPWHGRLRPRRSGFSRSTSRAPLQTNVEFYTALILHGLGLDVSLFTVTFALSRVSGWIAHALEQRATGRLIRPQSEYAGPRDRKWLPVSNRTDTSSRVLS
jgi:hypothetical protein